MELDLDRENKTYFACNKCTRVKNEMKDIIKHLAEDHPEDIDSVSEGFENDPFKLVNFNKRLEINLEKLKDEECEKYRENLTNFFLNNTTSKSTIQRKKKPASRYFSPRPFKCKICKISFRTKAYLKAHITIHFKEKPYSCSTCSKRFRMKANLKAHELTHEEKKFSCEYCERKFRKSDHLKSHLNLLNNNEPLTCEACDFVFNNKACLQYHFKMIHYVPITNNSNNRDRDLEKDCNFCGKRFSFNCNLKSHLEKAGQGETFNCNFCETEFNNRACLMHHTKSQHSQLPDSSNDSESLAKENNLVKITAGKIQYVCKYCNSEFNNFTLLQRHLTALHKKEDMPFKCPYPDCNKRYRRAWNLKYHRIAHAGIRKFICNICNKCFSNPSSLHSHRKMHKKRTEFHCQFCLKGFVHQENLKEHLKHVGTENEMQKCTNCETEYLSKLCLAYHMAVAHNIGKGPRIKSIVPRDTRPKMRYCRYCAKDCGTENALSLHERIHSGEKPEKCHMCPKAFRLPLSLQEHIRTHTGEKPYKCEICSKEYRTHAVFYSHKLTHTNRERKFKCENCYRGYFNKKSLQKHMNGYNEKNVFPCDICQQKFHNRLCVNYHFTSIHMKAKQLQEGENFIILKNTDAINCKYCSKQISHMFKLKMHQKEKGDFPCNSCDMKFPFRGCLYYHRTKHYDPVPKGERQKKDKKVKLPKIKDCSQCGEKFQFAFQLRDHLLKHTGERPEKCTICNLTFRLKSHLRSHIDKVHRTWKKKASTWGKDRKETYRKKSIKKRKKKNKQSTSQKRYSSKPNSALNMMNNQRPMAFAPNAVDALSIIVKEEAMDEEQEIPDHFLNDFHPTASNSMNFNSNYNSNGMIKFEETYECNRCESIFINETYLEEHVNKFHNSPTHHQTENEDSISNNSFNFSAKNTEARFPCKECDKNYSHKSGLFRHVRQAHKKPC